MDQGLAEDDATTQQREDAAVAFDLLKRMIGDSSFIFVECADGTSNLNVILNGLSSNTCLAIHSKLVGIYHGKTPQEMELPDDFDDISARPLARAVMRYLGSSIIKHECMDLCSFGDKIGKSRLTPLCQVLIWQALCLKTRKEEKRCVPPVIFPVFHGNDKLVEAEWKKGSMVYIDVEVGVCRSIHCVTCSDLLPAFTSCTRILYAQEIQYGTRLCEPNRLCVRWADAIQCGNGEC
jgi:hypothetical protein